MSIPTQQAIGEAFAAFVYERDDRKAPDAHCSAKFRVGWTAALGARCKIPRSSSV
jgi:5-methylcytosine-specific restriction protein A